MAGAAKVGDARKAHWRKDRNRKRRLYAKLGDREFWLFDPQGKSFDPPLDGFILQGGAYHPLPARLENGERVLRSHVLGLDMIVRGEERACGTRPRGSFCATRRKRRKIGNGKPPPGTRPKPGLRSWGLGLWPWERLIGRFSDVQHLQSI